MDPGFTETVNPGGAFTTIAAGIERTSSPRVAVMENSSRPGATVALAVRVRTEVGFGFPAVGVTAGGTKVGVKSGPRSATPRVTAEENPVPPVTVTV